jgi:hypothetical protein
MTALPPPAVTFTTSPGRKALEKDLTPLLAVPRAAQAAAVRQLAGRSAAEAIDNTIKHGTHSSADSVREEALGPGDSISEAGDIPATEAIADDMVEDQSVPGTTHIEGKSSPGAPAQLSPSTSTTATSGDMEVDAVDQVSTSPPPDYPTSPSMAGNADSTVPKSGFPPSGGGYFSGFIHGFRSSGSPPSS